MRTVVVSSSFRITIPKVYRERLNLRPGSRLTLVERCGELHLLPPNPATKFRGIAGGIDTTFDDEPDRVL
jgi:AbrB family looped-hinge helix DNA binding protein